MILTVTAQAFPALYNQFITNDFSRNERRPLYAIQRLYKRNQYMCLAMQEGDSLLAYACFIHADDVGGVLLDYFAVSETMRGTGIGSDFLTQLRETVDADGMIIESEMPDSANDAADLEIRERRIAFYERNGAELSPYGWRAFGVDYNLLWLPIRKAMSEVDMGAQIITLYSLTMPAFMMKAKTSLYGV